MYQGISTCYHHYHYPHYTHKDSAVTCQVVHLNQMGNSELASSPVKCSRPSPISTIDYSDSLVTVYYHPHQSISQRSLHCCMVLGQEAQCHSIKSPYLAKDPRSCPYQWTSHQCNQETISHWSTCSSQPSPIRILHKHWGICQWYTVEVLHPTVNTTPTNNKVQHTFVLDFDLVKLVKNCDDVTGLKNYMWSKLESCAIKNKRSNRVLVTPLDILSLVIFQR